jgi:hypothetical protein
MWRRHPFSQRASSLVSPRRARSPFSPPPCPPCSSLQCRSPLFSNEAAERGTEGRGGEAARSSSPSSSRSLRSPFFSSMPPPSSGARGRRPEAARSTGDRGAPPPRCRRARLPPRVRHHQAPERGEEGIKYVLPAQRLRVQPRGKGAGRRVMDLDGFRHRAQLRYQLPQAAVAQVDARERRWNGKKQRMEPPLEAEIFGWIPNSLKYENESFGWRYPITPSLHSI